MSFNKIIVVGNLGRDPELRYTPQGNAVCNFSMATNEKRRGRDGDMQDVTTWFRITLWGKQAENASKYLAKGSPVYIEGRLRVEEWSDRDGKSRYTLDVQATDMQFISSRGDEMSGSSQTTEGDFTDDFSGAASPANSPTDDDIPF
jgi:single-strand DNA-binding protein